MKHQRPFLHPIDLGNVAKSPDIPGQPEPAGSTTSASTNSKKTNLKKKRSQSIPFKDLSSNDFTPIRDLGSGSYGSVSLVNLHGEIFALKQVSKQKILQVDKVENVHFERDVLQAADNLYFPDFHFTF